ncbi:hypothetical protein E4U42_006109 [Claviceps africana]|uniref:Vps72/YL1 C-terminal domain-containing protein n=1 Tax=Claviceps africana TaxID=83212 RepID=A0A8K0JBI2_9HYPO|nr:hypothetical protein E4U42_006109 [Claviceps africana]
MSDQDTSQLSDPLSDLDSLSDSDAPIAPVAPIQQTAWLATTRERRSTAGNRMKFVLANEEPDSDLELLFAEDENDQGFSDVGEDASDVQMDSSSDDEDDTNANADDLEGEEELERQAKAKRAAQRKRKAQEAIPAKFRKKVRIDSTTTASTAPPPRPKKKSERTSWLPSPADLPTRASSRKTTRISKEQLHLQMAEREAKRLKQLAQMEKKAARLAAMKKPPMTQEERLAEAAIVEKRNSKSLNRWEEAEKQREQERKAKLAALNQRTLKGPFITFWSGKGQWDDLELRTLRPYVTEVEEKPKKKKEKADKGGARMKGKNKESVRATDGNEKDGVTGDKPGQAEESNNKDTTNVAARGPKDLQTLSAEAEPSAASGTGPTNKKDGPTNGNALAETMKAPDSAQPSTQPEDAFVSRERTPNAENATSLEKMPGVTPSGNVDGKSREGPMQSTTPAKLKDTRTDSDAEQPNETAPTRVTPVDCVPPSIDVPGSPSRTTRNPSLPTTVPTTVPTTGTTSTTSFSLSTTSTLSKATIDFAASPPSPPRHSALSAAISLSKPQEPRPSGVLAAPILAPPPGMDMNGTLAAEAPRSSILAPPTISLSEPSQVSHLEPRVSAETTAPMNVTHKAEAPDGGRQPLSNETAPTGKDLGPLEPEAPTTQPEPPRDMNATRNGIIFQNFNEVALRDKNTQTLVLFGRKMPKLAKPTAPPVCVITNYPARYQDPKTGLPFYNMHAYKELQRLYRGEYNWSRLLGAWVGSGRQAARGVPERFLNPSQDEEKRRKPDPALRDTSQATRGEEVTRDAPKPMQEGEVSSEQQQGLRLGTSPNRPDTAKPVEQAQNAP